MWREISLILAYRQGTDPSREYTRGYIEEVSRVKERVCGYGGGGGEGRGKKRKYRVGERDRESKRMKEERKRKRGKRV
jgi:hypothetical protein